jgi:hypothetical protein
MAAIDISSTAAPLNDGVLQLQNGVAIDGTLRFVTDQSNTLSPLKLSTTLVQTLSTLKITTADNPYIDAEDNSGNNRFTIGRDPSSQQVNLDFASNPTGSTTTVGAIRTYVNGSSLSEVLQFREDGTIFGQGTQAASNLVIQSDDDLTNLYLYNSACWGGLQTNTPSGNYNTTLNGAITGTHGGTGNSALALGSIVANTSGSNFNLAIGSSASVTGGPNATAIGYQANTSTANAIALGNANALLQIGGNFTPTARLHVRGLGSTSATTSLLVQNSAGVDMLRMQDDGKLVVGTTASGLGAIYVPRSITYGARAFLYNQDNNPMMRTISNDEMGVYLNCYFDRQVGIFGNLTTALSMTAQLSGANSTSSLIINSGTNWSTQANGTCIGINLQPVFDTDASSFSAKYIGFYWNPNIADLQLAKHYGIQTTSGGAYINTTTPQDSACLQADSTTQGFLPPRMTTAQKNAIAAPAIGLMVFDTTLGRPCFYNGAWVTL